MAPKLPQEFGPYTLHELIARGGMAEIYRATMPGIGGFEKTVAIKKILPHLAENDEFITMLIDEARIIVSINHANIAQVYDLGEIHEDYYIAMEYIHGIDLSTIAKDLKERGQTVPVEHAVFMASGIASGLHVAHNKCDDKGRPLHIVHRDVSPHNILISFAGDVKIIDFGVAKARGKEAHTQLGVIKGKLLYMSPEQAMAKEIDGRADLFAVGLILYRMLTNHLPFEGDNEFQIYNNILSKEIPPPKQFNPDIPEEVNQIVMMLLQRDPSKRYQDGYSAKVDLDRALQNLSPGYSISKLSRWVESNFSHLAEKKKPKSKRRNGPQSGQNDFVPSTPSRNSVGTGEMSSDSWDEIDEAEDTINLSMESPEAREVVRQAQEAREAWNAQKNQPMTQPNSAIPTSQNPAIPTSQNPAVPQTRPMGAAPQEDYQPRGSGSFPALGNDASTTGQQRTASSGMLTGGMPQQSPPEEESKFPLLPVLGILLLLLAIGGMLAYGVYFADDQSDAKAIETPKQGVSESDKATANEPAEPKEEPVAAEEVDAGLAEEPGEEAAETVQFSVKTEPSGATVFVDDEPIGETPLETEIPRSEDVVLLRFEKEKYESQEVRIIPFTAVRKNVELTPVDGAVIDEPDEKQEEAEKTEPKPKRKKRRPRRRRRRKPKPKPKPEPPKEEKDEPAIPLLGMDEEESASSDDKKEPKSKEDDDEDDIVNPFEF